MTDDRAELETSRAFGLRKRQDAKLAEVRKTTAYQLGRQEALDQKCGCILGPEHTLGDHIGRGGDGAAPNFPDESDERAIRREVAEEIAQALLDFEANDSRGRADMSIDRAVAICREIGARETL